MPQIGSQVRVAVERPRLLRLIDEPQLAPITLITAPAGYGKTTLAEQWARSQRQPVVWVALGPECNNLPSFLATLMTAMDRAGLAPGETLDAEVSVDAVMARFGATAEQAEVTVVADDYHLIENRDVHEMVETLLGRLPVTLHVVILSRTMPPLALGRLRAFGQVRELTEADLGFTVPEVEAVIAEELGDRLDASQIHHLAARTEGWIAGIRLALASMDSHDPAQVEQAIAHLADNPWLDEFLVEEVLDALPEALRDFVLQSAHLPWLEPGFCNAVLGIETSSGLMRDLRRRVGFVRRQGPDTGILVYHALFAECVQRIAARRFPSDQIRTLYGRAANWLEREGSREAALASALKAGDLPMAERIVRAICAWPVINTLSHSVLHWLRHLSEASISKDPEFAHWMVFGLLVTGQTQDAKTWLSRVEPGWLASGDRVQAGYAAECRSFLLMLEGERPIQLLVQALDYLPDDRYVERLHFASFLAMMTGILGDDDRAEAAFLEAARCKAHLPYEQSAWHLLTVIERTNHFALRGDLQLAMDGYAQGVRDLPSILSHHAPKHYHRQLAIYLERNDLELAAIVEAQCRTGIEHAPVQYWHTEARVQSARYQRISGQPEVAHATLAEVLTFSEAKGIRNTADRVRALQASWQLEDGQYNLARTWEHHQDAAAHRWMNAFGETNTWSTLIQLRVAEGQFARAATLARERIAEAEATNRWAEIIPFYMWDVVAQLGLGNEPAALVALGSALRIGGQGGFVRSFFPPGSDLAPFMQAARTQLPASEAVHLARVLDRMGIAVPAIPTGERPVGLTGALGVLTAREFEVLQLVCIGSPNRNIAERLFITERTVKKHVGNILFKLEVPNRTAAVVRARQLGLPD